MHETLGLSPPAPPLPDSPAYPAIQTQSSTDVLAARMHVNEGHAVHCLLVIVARTEEKLPGAHALQLSGPRQSLK
jgi:hypothetical protein